MYYFCSALQSDSIRFSPNGDYVAGPGNTYEKGHVNVLPSQKLLSLAPIEESDILSIPFDAEMNDWDYEITSWSSINELFIDEYPFNTYYPQKGAFNEDHKMFKIDSDGNKKYLAKHACCGDANPDADKIIYTDTTDGEVWIMDNNGGDKTQLTNNGNMKFNPVWSHDGSYILWTELKEPSGEKMFGKTKGIKRYVIMMAKLKEE